MRIAIKTPKGFVELEGEDKTNGLDVFKFDVRRLKFMMACDTGWTGIVFKAQGREIMIFENEKHIVDCSKVISY